MENTKRKYMKIEAYQIFVYEKEDVERRNGILFDFSTFETKFQELKNNKKTQLTHGLSIHELNNINQVTNDQNTQYELLFSKLEETDYPIVVDDTGTISNMSDNISNDKRIGHITCGIYDEAREVLLLQSNFNAMTVNNVEDYLNKLFIDENHILKIVPLIDRTIFNKAKSSFKTKIEVSLHVRNQVLPEDSPNTYFFRKFREGLEMNAVNISFSYSMGHVRKDSLEESISNQLLDDIANNMNIVGSAKVSFKNQLEDKVTYADLLLHKIHTIVYFDIPERSTLREQTILNKIKENYIAEFDEKLRNYFINITFS